MKILATMFFCASVLLTCARGECQPAKGSGRDATDLCRAAALAYAENVGSFTRYECRYSFMRGTADNIAAARQGKIRNAETTTYRLVVDGARELCDNDVGEKRKSEPQILKKNGQDHVRLSAFGAGDKFLTDGQNDLNYDPVLSTVNLLSRSKGECRIPHSPMGFEFIGHRNGLGPDRLLMKPESYRFVPLAMDNLDGRAVVGLRFDRIEHENVKTTFYLDPDAGYLPRQIRNPGDGKSVKTEVVLQSELDCGKGRFFPEHILAFNYMDPDSAVLVSEIRVLKFTETPELNADTFSVKVPAGTVIKEVDSKTTNMFKLKQDEVINAADIPVLFSMLEARVGNDRMDTALSAHRPRTWGWYVQWAGLAVAAMGLFWLAYRRWRLAAGR